MVVDGSTALEHISPELESMVVEQHLINVKLCNLQASGSRFEQRVS